MLKFIQTAALGNWETTLSGLVFAVLLAINPILMQNRWPNQFEWTLILGSVIKGLVSKDHNKVGTGSMAEPIRGPAPEDNKKPSNLIL